MRGWMQRKAYLRCERRQDRLKQEGSLRFITGRNPESQPALVVGLLRCG
jgi:hypothetical protein